MEPNGLILHNAGKGQDFIAVELVDGHLHYVFNLGDGPRGVKSNTRTTLNDNQWHAVTIGRPSLHQHTLMVDDMITKVIRILFVTRIAAVTYVYDISKSSDLKRIRKQSIWLFLFQAASKS